MTLRLARITLFTKDMPGMTAFYGTVLGLKLVTDEKGFKEYDAGGCRIALHNGTSRIGTRAPKLVFWADDVAALRARLVARGAKFGPVQAMGKLARCDGHDPDGNAVGLSNRP